MSSKGQVGMVEMIMVVVVIAILLGIGLFFYFKFFQNNIEQTAEDLETQESNVLLILAANLPELECSRIGATKNCIDAAKALSAQTTMQDQRYRADYTELFGFRSLSIDIIYPDVQNRTCTQATYPDCSHYELFTNKPVSYQTSKKYSVVTPLYYPETKTVHIGSLVLEVYS